MSAEFEKEIQRLSEELNNKEELIERLKGDIQDLEDELNGNATTPIKEEDDETVKMELLLRSGADFSMVNEIKVGLFFDNIDRFTLEEFEAFFSKLK